MALLFARPFQSDVDYIMYTITVNPVMIGGSESGPFVSARSLRDLNEVTPPGGRRSRKQ